MSGRLQQETAVHRAQHEREHGEWLAANDPEATWGWGSPAGQMRAARRARAISEAAHLAPGIRVLEVGCGTGIFTERFATSGSEITAVDISEPLLAFARQHRSAPRIRYRCARFEDLVEAPFDAVVGSSVLHHLELDRSLERIHELLRPGGRLCFAEPNLVNPQVFLERKARFLKIFDYVSPDETAFVRWPLRRLLLRHGFRDVVITPFDFLHPSTPRPLIPVISALGRAIESLPGLREFAGSLLIVARRL